MTSSFDLQSIALHMVALLLSLSIHEAVRSGTALALGDDTAARSGRFTLNPIPHINLFGTIIFPLLILVFSGGHVRGIYGWAKPIPASPSRFTRRFRLKTSIALVSAAGIAASLVLSFLFIGIGCLVVRSLAATPPDRWPLLQLMMDGPSSLAGLGIPLWKLVLLGFSGTLIWTNILLMGFNLIPVAPLDGAAILRGLLPDRALPAYDRIQTNPYTWLVLFLLIWLGPFDRFVLEPFQHGMLILLSPVAHLLLGA